MKFTCENKNAETNGTSLSGHIQISPDKLERVFGTPITDGDKTSVEWCFISDEGEVFTLYDWKYRDDQRWNTNKILMNIGSHSAINLDNFKSFLESI